MNWVLLRTHPRLTASTQWMLLATSALALTGVMGGAMFAAREPAAVEAIRRAAWPASVLLVWANVSVQLLWPLSRTRASAFSMALPLSGRRLWGISLIASALSTAAAVVLLTAVLAAAERVLGLRMGTPVLLSLA